MKVVVRALVRWAWILVLCVIVGWLGGKELAVLIPPTYQASAIVQLNGQARNAGGTAVVQSVAAYANMVTSDEILGTVLKNYPRLNRQSLGKQLVVTPDNNGQDITISATLTNPKDAAGLVNDLAKAFVAQQNAVIKQQYDTQVKLLSQNISDEQKQMDELTLKIAQTPPTNTVLIQSLQDQRNQIQGLQTQNVTSRENLLTQQALYSTPLSVIQYATVPTHPSTLLGQLPMVPLTMFILLLIGGSAIILLEQWADRINSVYALQQKVALPIFGTLRWTTPGPKDMPLRAFCELKQPYVEQCRVMMADILFHAEETQAHLVAVTALKPNAGASSVAAQLAALLAQSRRRVLLIDANLHNPSLHQRLEVHNEAGLARMLEEARMMKVAVSPGSNYPATNVIDHMPIDNYILPSPLQNLYILTAGRPSMNPASLLSMPEMGHFLKWAAQRSDYIVIDCPSFAFAEAHVLGSLSDQTYVVVDVTKDRMKQVVAIRDELMGSSVKLSGLVANKLGRWI